MCTLLRKMCVFSAPRNIHGGLNANLAMLRSAKILHYLGKEEYLKRLKGSMVKRLAGELHCECYKEGEYVP